MVRKVRIDCELFIVICPKDTILVFKDKDCVITRAAQLIALLLIS